MIKYTFFNRQNTNLGPVSRISTKIKGAIRGSSSAVDCTSLEATETPSVWDGGSEPQILIQTNFIKSRRDKEHNLDAFMSAFMHSIEQSLDVGEDVIEMHDPQESKPNLPGSNLTFGNLFELNSNSPHPTVTTNSNYSTRGPSQCLIYILVRIIRAPLVIIRFALAFICISEKTVDSLLCTLIKQLIKLGLYEPRLAHAIELLHEVLFLENTPDPTPEELFARQQTARTSITSLRGELGRLFDTLQSPPLNKHLMYCLLDIILADVYPELQQQKL